MTFKEETLDSEIIYEGKIINLRRDHVTVINGDSYREIVEHSGGAVIAAITDDNKMVMVRQFRKAAESVVFEAPAGKIDPNEDPLKTALRELKEETGYTAKNIREACHFYTSVGFSDEVLYLYVCTGLTPGETDFDENEALDIELWDIDELAKMVYDGKIVDAKTIIAIQFAKNEIEKRG